MEITQEMVNVYGYTWHRTPPGAPGDRTRAGLAAVFAHLESQGWKITRDDSLITRYDHQTLDEARDE